MNCRLSLPFRQALVHGPQFEARRSLEDSAFPGRAREREPTGVTIGEKCHFFWEFAERLILSVFEALQSAGEISNQTIFNQPGVCMSSYIQPFIISLVLFACSQVFAAPDEKLDYFVFLVTGKPTQGAAKEDIEKMQASHLENFGRLAKIGET